MEKEISSKFSNDEDRSFKTKILFRDKLKILINSLNEKIKILKIDISICEDAIKFYEDNKELYDNFIKNGKISFDFLNYRQHMDECDNAIIMFKNDVKKIQLQIENFFEEMEENRI